jgi:hypothetical protein
MTDDARSRPRLSVILATTRPWPEIRASLEALLVQAERVGAELIVADGDGRGLESSPEPVVWLRRPGADRFALHAAALASARADIVAVTEDHCVVTADWCERILAAHAAHPEAPCIVGAVRNGADRHALERASFLVTSAPYMPPLTEVPIDRSPPFNNLSLKRSTLNGVDLRPTWFEYELVPRLWSEGALLADKGVVVTHTQLLDRRRALAIHFHNGRAHGGLFATEPASERRARAREALRVPRRILGQTKRACARRGVELPVVDAVAVWLVAAAHAFGYLYGLLAGVGRSAHRLT